MKTIEKNELDIKRTQLCLLCRKYIKNWKKHLVACEVKFKKDKGIKI